MAKTAYINARVENKLKKDAEKVLKRVGVKTSDAVGKRICFPWRWA